MAMTAYRQYWALTALILCAGIYAIYAGVLTWGIAKFPEIPIQIVFGLIVAVFVWVYATAGHKAAKMIGRNEYALDLIQKDIALVGKKSEIEQVLVDTASLRGQGAEKGQSDFNLLYDVMREQLEVKLMDGIGRVDTVRVFMFFIGLLFTLIGVVQGFASQQFPTNPEEAKLYSFTIIKALGLAYLPTAACIGSTLVLFVLSSVLQNRVKALLHHFDIVLYRTAVLGQTSSGRKTSERTEYATASKSA